MAAQGVTNRTEDYSRWYTDVVKMADLADYAAVRGCMIIKPYGYELWENIKSGLDKRFKATGHRNAYFPLFIPMSFIEKEAKHVEGFAPQLAIVTHAGGKKLDEPLAIRPTSETVIGHAYAQWIQSYRDLPVLINQWANVVRWEMRPRLFLRTSEFLWQEGHTAHATEEEAEEETIRMLDIYADFAVKDAAIPVIKGEKSGQEKFAGASRSFTIEAMMGNTWALQSGTSHYLAQNFARAFDIKFLDEENKLKYCYTTSWGVSTRMVGGIVMAHGDDKGLRLPPHLAPIQVVIVPIWRTVDQRGVVMKAIDDIRSVLVNAGVRVHIDKREGMTPGFKFNDWEMRGVPARMEIGPRDVESGTAILARRDMQGKDAKQSVSQDGIAQRVLELLADIQNHMLAQATEFRDAHLHRANSYDELKEIVTDGWALIPHCGASECEQKIKEETKSSSRCYPITENKDWDPRGKSCPICGKPAVGLAYFARSY